MAIVSEVPGLVVTIDVAGQNLAEYDDNDVEEPQPLATMKYVEATSGANFGVATSYDPFVFSHVNDHIRYHLYLDGKHIRAWTHSPNKIAIGHRSVLEHVRSNLGDRMVKKQFSFAELQISKCSSLSCMNEVDTKVVQMKVQPISSFGANLVTSELSP